MKSRVARDDPRGVLDPARRKTPIAETPTSVEVKIVTATGEQVIPLKASPDSPIRGERRFVSASGPYELNQVGGEVKVQVGGKTLSGEFRGPR